MTGASVIVCTYRRAAALRTLLTDLAEQTTRPAEVIVVDGSGADSSVALAVQEAAAAHPRLPLRYRAAAAGLTHQRNVGLSVAAGDPVCFLDDDVSLPPDFLGRAMVVLATPACADVGGITGWDVSYFAQPLTAGWRLRRWLGIVPPLEPGAVDRIGRRVPLELAPRTAAPRAVGWLPGCCMIYRRAALAGLRFDELLPTYAGEDKEFSAEVARRWRLLLVPDLHYVHHRTPAVRDAEWRRLYQVGFGMGRGFARRALRGSDVVAAVRYTIGEAMLQLLRAVRRPRRADLRAVAAVPAGVIAGLRSARAGSEASP